MAPNLNASESKHMSPLERGLRLTAIWSWPFAMALNIAHAVTANNPVCAFPSVGLIPATLSSAVSVVLVTGGLKTIGKWLVAIDLGLAVLFISLLIPSWVIMASGYWWDPGPLMLAAYATMPLMANFSVHAFLFLKNIVPTVILPAITCPHCNGDLFHRRAQGTHAPVFHRGRMNSIDSQESYEAFADDTTTNVRAIAAPEMSKKTHEIRMVDDTVSPRPSTDDETARLV